jgi:hypothetical protein
MTTSRNITVTANQSKRTFTIKADGAKYITSKMSKEEFEENEYNTQSDWASFLNTGDYYKA